MPKFRYGTVNLDAVDPLDLEQLRNQIDAGVSQWRDIVTDDGSLESVLEVARDPYLIRDETGDPESIYFRYVLRDTSEYQSVDDRGHDETRVYEPREVTDFVLTADGNMAYEASGSPRGPLGFLFGEADPRPFYVAGIPFSQEDLQAHYDHADRVTKIGLSMADLEPGDEPGTVESLSEAADEAAAFAENLSFTVGHFHETRDLREPVLVNEIVARAEIDRVSAVHGAESSIELSESGWADFHVPEDVEAQERANIIRNRVAVLF